MGRSTSFWTNRWKWVTRTFDTFFFFWILLEEESLFSLKPHSFRGHRQFCAREGNMSTESLQGVEAFVGLSDERSGSAVAAQRALEGAPLAALKCSAKNSAP